jgi:hypothetical protein
MVTAGYEMFAINPKAVDRYRDRHRLAGGKSDAADAKVLADLVRTDRHLHRPVAADTESAEALSTATTDCDLFGGSGWFGRGLGSFVASMTSAQCGRRRAGWVRRCG